MTFYADRAYDPALDVRDPTELSHRIQQNPADGKVWLLVSHRRGRKTWTLKGLARDLRGVRAKFFDLRHDPLPEKTPKQGYYFLLDEPLALLKNPEKAQHFIATCASLHSQNARVVIAVTPAECELLLQYGQAHALVCEKAIVGIKPLVPAEAQLLASRSSAAIELLGKLPAAWRRSAFLLELLFQLQERNPTATPAALLRAAIEECRATRTDYFVRVFQEGLSDAHRQVLRQIVRGQSVSRKECGLLLDAALIEREDSTGRYYLADPILAAYFAPLRIHHVSDVHVGPKSAQTIDAKDKGPLSIAADSGAVRDSYVQHLAQLEAEGAAPHLIVISGDLTEYATEDQLTDARAWVERLRRHLAADPQLDPQDPRILIVGGNHDVNWTLTLGGSPQARHRPFAEAFASYPRPQLEQPPESRPVATVGYPDFGLEFLLLGSAELGGQVDEAQERDLLLKELAALLNPTNEEERKKVHALALQAARDDPGLVHEQDLRRALGHRWLGPVRIAVLHHPVSALPTVTEIARYAGLLNAGAVKDCLLARGFCLVLHGHTHSAWFGIEHWPGLHGERKLHIASAPSLSSREVQENHGYNALELTRDYDEAGRALYALTVRRVLRRGAHSWEQAAAMPRIELQE